MAQAQFRSRVATVKDFSIAEHRPLTIPDCNAVRYPAKISDELSLQTHRTGTDAGSHKSCASQQNVTDQSTKEEQLGINGDTVSTERSATDASENGTTVKQEQSDTNASPTVRVLHKQRTKKLLLLSGKSSKKLVRISAPAAETAAVSNVTSNNRYA